MVNIKGFIEVHPVGTNGDPLLVNLNCISDVRPEGSGALICFSIVMGNGFNFAGSCFEVIESYGELLNLIKIAS